MDGYAIKQRIESNGHSVPIPGNGRVYIVDGAKNPKPGVRWEGEYRMKEVEANAAGTMRIHPEWRARAARYY